MSVQPVIIYRLDENPHFSVRWKSSKGRVGPMKRLKQSSMTDCEDKVQVAVANVGYE